MNRRTNRPHAARLAYTLVEMLTTIAILVIVLGLMVSLTRRVRSQSAERLTTQLLRDLDRLMADYAALTKNADASALPIKPLIGSPAVLDEATLERNAKANNDQFMRLLRAALPRQSKFFDELPASNYDPGSPGRPGSLRDAWGNPIVFMARSHPLIGTAPGGASFFFSAGPDGRFLTRADNLYSYERALTADEVKGEADSKPSKSE